MTRPIFIVLIAAGLLAVPMGAKAQDDRPPKDDQRELESVPARRGIPIVEAAIKETKTRLERLESLRRSLENGEEVSREEFHEAMALPDGPRGDQGRRPGARDELMREGGPGRKGGLGPPGDPQWRVGWKDLDEAHKKRVREFLLEHAPQAAQLLERANGPVADRILSKVMAPRAIQVLAAEDENPRFGELALDDFKAGVELFRAGRALREAFVQHGEQSDEFAEALSSYRTAIEHELDAKLGMRLYEFEQLETRLTEQRQALENERAQREERIERSLEQVVRRLRHMRQGAEAQPGRRGRPGEPRPPRGDAPPRGEGPRGPR